MAQELGRPFIDMDSRIEERRGQSIKEIFASCGQAAFRRWEKEEAARCGIEQGAVIATGGGVVLDAGNVQALKANGYLVFLDRLPKAIMDNSSITERPLLAAGQESLAQLALERRPLYLATADEVLPVAANFKDSLNPLLALAQGATCRGFAVIGDPIGHSLSPLLHRAVFKALNIDIPYNALRIPQGYLKEFIRGVRGGVLQGFTVTIPHKREILPFLDEVRGGAALCGAVNTVMRDKGRLIGYNTDMEGLLLALKRQGYSYAGQNVLILGAGGAAAGVAYKAGASGARVTVLARRAGQAAALSPNFGELNSENLSRESPKADILINATPLGMKDFGADFPDLSFLANLPAGALVCDLVYNPAATSLLKEAARLGLAVMNGMEMLIWQAILAEQIFVGLDKFDFAYEIMQKAISK
ncbi:MAG: shikimate dehydrogenase [Clostridiales bacterium]|nr:shikimate dehydrogenase [Clostridiales bacterium]